MLVRVSLSVQNVGQAEELADIHRPHRLGAVIGALVEQIERAHPGVSILQHAIIFRSEPAADRTRKSAEPAIIR